MEAHLQELLAADHSVLEEGYRLVRREYPTAVGPVDLLCRDAAGRAAVAVEVKRRGETAGVEQLSRYLEFLNADPALHPVQGMLVAEEIKPQARVLADKRGIRCMVVDYAALRGDKPEDLRTVLAGAGRTPQANCRDRPGMNGDSSSLTVAAPVP